MNNIVYTYTESNISRKFAGFKDELTMLTMLALSYNQSKKIAKKVTIYTNSEFNKLILSRVVNKDDIIVIKDYYDINSKFWALNKLRTCAFVQSSIMEEFYHIDIDFILWEKLDKIKPKLFVFQEYESFENPKHSHYIMMANEIKNNFGSLPLRGFAYNCGIMGFRSVIDFEHLIRTAENFIKDNDYLNYSQFDYNFIFEQALIANYCPRNETATLTDMKTKFTHLWGNSKNNTSNIIRVRGRLENDYPNYIDVIRDIEENPTQMPSVDMAEMPNIEILNI